MLEFEVECQFSQRVIECNSQQVLKTGRKEFIKAIQQYWRERSINLSHTFTLRHSLQPLHTISAFATCARTPPSSPA